MQCLCGCGALRRSPLDTALWGPRWAERYGLSGMTRSVSAGPTAARRSSRARVNGPTSSRKSVLVLGRRVGLRRLDAAAELPVALGRRDVGPDERRGVGAP